LKNPRAYLKHSKPCCVNNFISLENTQFLISDVHHSLSKLEMILILLIKNQHEFKIVKFMFSTHFGTFDYKAIFTFKIWILKYVFNKSYSFWCDKMCGCILYVIYYVLRMIYYAPYYLLYAYYVGGCNTYMDLWSLTNVTKINHFKTMTCEYNVNFDVISISKILNWIYYYFISHLITKNENKT